MKRLVAILLAISLAALAADRVPPAPTRYFTQQKQLVSPATAEALNQKLEEFEKKTSSQILVVIYPKLPDGAALEDFTVRAAQAWGVGQKGKDNGAILFIFVADRKMRIEVGYGLEGAIPDAVAKRIIDDEIRPRFRQGDMEAGVVAGVNALIQAAQGEYRGTGTTVAQRRQSGRVPCGSGIILALFLVVLFSMMARGLGGGTMYHRRRRRHGYWGTPWIPMGGWTSGGRSSSGWSGGGFSGGGGRFGGGGASGGW